MRDPIEPGHAKPTDADLRAAHLLIGCQYPAFCGWAGVCEVQYMNSQGPKYRSCRLHAASFREDDNYAVRDSGRPNRLLVTDNNSGGWRPLSSREARPFA